MFSTLDKGDDRMLVFGVMVGLVLRTFGGDGAAVDGGLSLVGVS
jgi:hypothetical protein